MHGGGGQRFHIPRRKERKSLAFLQTGENRKEMKRKEPKLSLSLCAREIPRLRNPPTGSRTHRTSTLWWRGGKA